MDSYAREGVDNESFCTEASNSDHEIKTHAWVTRFGCNVKLPKHCKDYALTAAEV